MERVFRGVLVLILVSMGFAVSAADTAFRSECFPGAGGWSQCMDVFAPTDGGAGPRPGVVLFHGGGWSQGERSWIHAQAQWAAEHGLVAISADYRLSGRDGVTPFDALEDARAALRWTRANAKRLGIDPHRIAAGGVSAGGHLAAAAAVFDMPFAEGGSARPDALLLWSAAVAAGDDPWFVKLTGGHAQARALSPDRHLRGDLPPTIVLQGAEDSVTPLAGAQRFCASAVAAGRRCELHVYPGVGHLFTRDLQHQESPDWKAFDREVDRRADEAVLAFLRGLGYLQR